MFDSVQVDGVDVYYQVTGEGSPVVFLHGFSGTHLSWWRQIPSFADDYRCIAPDQRGFGYSRDAPDGPGAAAFVSDLRALLDHLGHDRVAVVGHSMSGWPAASFATQHPDRVAALVLSGTPGGLLDRERHEALCEAAGSLPSVDPLSAEHAFLDESIAELNVDAPDEFDAVRPTLEALPTDADRIVEAGIPALLLAGEADQFMPAPALDALRDRLDGARRVTVEGAGHSTLVEQPAAFAGHVAAFLDERAQF
ncbi:MAG: alpha/beta fold hydrolase [Haloarculaceae archaeon]